MDEFDGCCTANRLRSQKTRINLLQSAKPDDFFVSLVHRIIFVTDPLLILTAMLLKAWHGAICRRWPRP